MANRLARETSPYLLQHADNPVDWYPWGEEALATARSNDRPILLSIGYSACHWCHVMAHESFENDEIARMMNDLFVNIKVDREERPDLDSLYMTSVQMMTGHGGWPMTVFLTPEGKPFYGGTYFPPADRGPMPGFPRVLQGVAEAFNDRREQVESAADQLAENIDSHFRVTLTPGPLNATLLDTAFSNLARQFDRPNGGFGAAPKFPSPMSVEFLLRYHARTGNEDALSMAEHTLDRMARGGLYDQVGGGFHRYTVDAIWLVPHFEKMLYDNSQLSYVYALAHQLTRESFYRVIAEETLDYVLREMKSPDGGFYSTQDADTEGEEGKFYVWRPNEIEDTLGTADGATVAKLLGVTERGNFEGSNVLSIRNKNERMVWRDNPFDSMRRRLFEARESRMHPGRDEKILTSWNGLMMRSFATAGWVFGSDQYTKAARENALFIRNNLISGGRLRHSFKDGGAKIEGFLEDYAFLIDGLLALYQATFEPEWIDWALELSAVTMSEFYDEDAGAFYDTAVSGEALISRPRDAYDNATPSGNSVIVDVLARLAHLTGNIHFARVSDRVLEDFAPIASEQPHGFSRLLLGVDFAVGPNAEVAVVGERGDARTEEMINALRNLYLPRAVIACDEPGGAAVETIDLLADRTTIDSRPTAYVCVNQACRLPTADSDEMVSQLKSILREKRG